MSQEIKSRFYKTPNKLHELEITDKEFRLLSYLLKYQNFSTTYPSISTIGKDCHMSMSSAKRTIKSLGKKELVFIKSGKPNHLSNEYTVNLDKIDRDCLNSNKANITVPAKAVVTPKPKIPCTCKADKRGCNAPKHLRSDGTMSWGKEFSDEDSSPLLRRVPATIPLLLYFLSPICLILSTLWKWK